MTEASRHRLLERQLKKAAGPDGAVDVDRLLELVSKAYDEYDNTLRLNDRAARLMSGELSELNDKLRQESEARAKISEALLQTVLDNADEAIISLGSDHMVLSANRVAEQTFGYRPGEMIGKPLSVLFECPDEAEDHQRFSDKGPQARALHVNEVQCRRSTGEAFPAELSFSRIPIENDVRLISFWRDISSRKAAQAELISAAEEAQAASLSKSNFLANMSHELRTPLNAIIGFSDLLLSELHGPALEVRHKEYIKDIADSGAHLLQLVNDILDLSRIESGRYDLVLEPIHLIDVTASVIRQLGPMSRKGQLELLDTISGALWLMADRRALRQVLYNLLSNAIKFTRPGGRVSLSATRVDEGVEIAVEDNGIGMPRDALPRLGNPFEQVANSYARAHGGAGLGLAITRKLVGLQNGVLSFDSELGVGSVFRVWLPIASALARTA